MPLKSAGSTSLSAPGYLGTYLVVPAGGATVNFTVNATEGGSSGAAPHMNLVIADSAFGLNISSTSATNYNDLECRFAGRHVFCPNGARLRQ